MSISQRLEKNIDFFAGKFRVRVKTKQGEIREYCETAEEARKILKRIRKSHPPRIENGVLKVAHRGTSHPKTGVVKHLRIDRRKKGNPEYLAFSVSWQDESGRNRVTSFQAGNVANVEPSDVKHAERTAIAFRDAYEAARLNNKPFVPAAFAAWRTLQCYPWTSITEWKQTAAIQVEDNPEVIATLPKASVAAFLAGPIKSGKR